MWGGLFRIFLYQHATFSVNSICHMFGRQQYRTRDEARNNWVVALLVFGEGWHNNHHAFPASARHGLGRLQLDVSWWVIRALERAASRQERQDAVGRPAGSAPSASERELTKRRSSSSTSSAQRSAFGSAEQLPPRRSERDAVERAGNEDVAAVGATLAGTVEALLRVRRGHAGDSRQPAVERPVEDGEPLASERADVELIRDPRREAHDLLDGWFVRDRDGNRPAHREPEQDDARRAAPPRWPHAHRRRTTRGAATTSPGSAPPRSRARAGVARASARAIRSTRSTFPSTSRAWPPFTQTTAHSATRPVTRISAPVESLMRRLAPSRRAMPAAREGTRVDRVRHVRRTRGT